MLRLRKLDLPHDPAIPHRGIYPKVKKTYAHKNVLTLNVHSRFSSSSPKLETELRCPSTGEERIKLWSIHTMASYLAMKRNTLQIHETTWMNIDKVQNMLPQNGANFDIVF